MQTKQFSVQPRLGTPAAYVEASFYQYYSNIHQNLYTTEVLAITVTNYEEITEQ